jgi:hypothetical protein
MPDGPSHSVPAQADSTKATQTDDTVCGVDRDLVERFLGLIRDNYEKADRSSFFLEEVAGKTHSLVAANLRDVLSHLATMLQPDLSREHRKSQLATAEEHFRRAIQEPYAIALGNLRERFNKVHDNYLRVLPFIEKAQKRGLFDGALTDSVIQVRLRGIAASAAAGRGAKRQNQINAEWDLAVAKYAEAYDGLEALTHKLSSTIHEYEAVERNSASRRWSLVGAIGTLVFGLLSALFVLYPSLLKMLQHKLGIVP